LCLPDRYDAKRGVDRARISGIAVKAFRMAFVSEERIRPDRDVAIAARYNVPGKRQVGHRRPGSDESKVPSALQFLGGIVRAHLVPAGTSPSFLILPALRSRLLSQGPWRDGSSSHSSRLRIGLLWSRPGRLSLFLILLPRRNGHSWSLPQRKFL
jgi:hypothetical protein